MSEIDLHIHTCYSADGEFKPAEIIKLASKKQLEAVAITDHDTVEGLEEAIKTGREYNIEVVPGIEFDTEFQKENLHILGYYLDWKAPELDEVTEQIRNSQYQQAKARVKLLQEMGFKLSWQAVEKEAAIIPVGGIIAKVLLNNGLNEDDERLIPYLDGKRSGQPYFNFYLDYFLPGKPAYIKNELPDAREVIELIHSLGGVAVLAHPGSAISLDENEEILYKLIERGLDGLEAYSTYHSPKEVIKFTTWAKEEGLLITAGSDFHGKLKPEVKLGGVDGNDYQLLTRLKEMANR